MLQRPKDLDTASSLAILQEEVLLGQSSREYKKLDHSQAVKRSFSQSVSASGGHSVKPAVSDSSPAESSRFVQLTQRLMRS